MELLRDAPDTLRGLARVATIVDSLRRSIGRAARFSSTPATCLQGTALTYVAARVDTTMQEPGDRGDERDANTTRPSIGNHEFDYGLPALDRALQRGQLSAPRRQRVRAERTAALRRMGRVDDPTRRQDRDRRRHDARRDGAGTATSSPGSCTVRDIVPDVRSAVREARNAGAAVVIVVVHSGLDEPSTLRHRRNRACRARTSPRALAHEVPGIDVIVYGHSHKEMADTVIAGTLLMQPKNWATSVAVAQLRLERRNGRWAVIVQARPDHPRRVHHRENPQVLAVTQEGHRARRAVRDDDDRHTPAAWRADSARVVDTPLIDFVLEVERRASGAQLASTAVFSLDARSPPGPITVARMAALYPYDNTLRAVRITGAQLRAYLEQSARYFRADANGRRASIRRFPGYNYDVVAGVDYTIDVSRPIGERVTRARVPADKPVAPADTFTMALNNYRQTGGGGFSMLHDAPVVYDRQRGHPPAAHRRSAKRGTIRPSSSPGRSGESCQQGTANWRRSSPKRRRRSGRRRKRRRSECASLIARFSPFSPLVSFAPCNRPSCFRLAFAFGSCESSSIPSRSTSRWLRRPRCRSCVRRERGVRGE